MFRLALVPLLLAGCTCRHAEPTNSEPTDAQRDSEILDSDDSSREDNEDSRQPDTGEPPEPELRLPSPFGLFNGLNAHEDSEKSLEQVLVEIEEGNIAQMLELGMGASRVHDQGYVSFSWFMIDPERELSWLDFSRTDAVVELACANDIYLLPTTGPATRAEVRTDGYLPDPEGYRVFMEELLERYDGDEIFQVNEAITEPPSESAQAAIRACPLQLYQFGNEPDIFADQLIHGYSAQVYADALRLAQHAAAEVAPQTRFAYGGLSWRSSTVEPCWDFFLGVIERLGDDLFDEIGLHMHPEDLDTRLMVDQLERVAAALPEGTPIWISEIGISSLYKPDNRCEDENASERSQARQVLLVQLATLVRDGRSVLHGEIDMPVETCPYFDGIQFIHPDEGYQRLAWYAYRSMTGWFAGVDVEGIEAIAEGEDEGRYAYRLPLREGGELYLLAYDPGSLDDYEAGGALDSTPRVFTLEDLAGDEVTVWESMPTADSGQEVQAATYEPGSATVPLADGVLEIEVGARPVWVQISE